MSNPDWYAAWRDDAIDQLKVKNKRLEEEFGVGRWPRYDYDLTSEKLLFSDKGVVKVVAEIQLAGSTSAKANNWLWAWADSNMPDHILADAKLVRAFGEKNGIDELAQTYVIDTQDDLEVLGWELSAIMVRICDTIGVYRSPHGEGGGIYLILKSIAWAS